MLKRRVYYLLKPYLPWSVRMTLRRLLAERVRRDSAAVWPIDRRTVRRPEGWTGWPEGRDFAVVLTHDVEGPSGLAKCRRLAEFEANLGFRSSFNLIPEGDYAVPTELRNWLTDHGFEVGIHDLHHDGKLYANRDAFRRNAGRINRYLKEWGAVGFRSGFMLHELDWIHDLDIAYDASTFDTDPFEPQPDTFGTLFPYWIGKPAADGVGSGYFEFPYTLPQDSTLFLVLRERTPKIWLEKADWLVEQRATVLVNVHPDYLRFPGERPSPRTFPIEHYGQLLEGIRDRYHGRYWQPLPRQLAGWMGSCRNQGLSLTLPGQTRSRASSKPAATLQGKRAAVLLYAYYPSDTRPQRAADAMAAAGMDVDLLCLTEHPGEGSEETFGRLRVRRLPFAHRRTGLWSYLKGYSRFFLASCRFLMQRRYDVVHVHNMPDFLALAALPSRLRGAKVILDLHDPMPELMMSIHGLPERAWPVRVLRALERWSIRASHLVLTPNLTFRNIFVARGCPEPKIEIIMNSPDEKDFDRSRFGALERPADNGQFRIMHHGSIVHRHGLDLLVEAAAKVRARIPGLQVDIYGPREPFLDVVLQRAQQLGVDDIVRYCGNKSASDIARAILDADLGVIPNRRSVFTETNFPTRIFEFLAMGRPVIAPSTRGIRDYFGPDELPMFEQDNVDDLATRIVWVRNNPDAARAMLDRGIQVYERHRWSDERDRFVGLVSELLAAR